MKPVQTLPGTYHPAWSFDIRRGFAILIWLNVFGLGLLFLSTGLFSLALYALRPLQAAQGLSMSFAGLGGTLAGIANFLGLYAVMIVLHEVAHGICFWVFTRQRPQFAFKGFYAYAAAPTWFLPRDQYFLTALAPLASLSLGVLLVFAFAPPAWFLPALVIGVLNASGAVADLWVAARLLRFSPTSLAQDKGEAITIYTI